MKGKPITVEDLVQCEGIFKLARLRGNFPTNYAVDRNIDRLGEALKPFRAGLKEEPLSFKWDEKATADQREKAEAAFLEWMRVEVEYEPYTLDVTKLCPELSQLSSARENLDEEHFRLLRENFYLALDKLGILRDEA